MNDTKKDFPMDVGDTIEVDGETWEFVDWPTDGPLFRNLDEDESEFEMCQIETDDVEEFLAENMEASA